MSVGADEPEDRAENQDEFLADDSLPVEEIEPSQKRIGAPSMTREESAKLSETIWAEYAAGLNMQEIGDLHGITAQTVGRRIRIYRKNLGLESIEEAKSLDLGRYEALIERIWTKTFKNPTPENVKTMAMLMDQRAKLLGLNAPRKLQVDGQVNIAPSPAMLGVLDRLAEERSKLDGTLTRPEIMGPNDDDTVDAELIDGPD